MARRSAGDQQLFQVLDLGRLAGNDRLSQGGHSRTLRAPRDGGSPAGAGPVVGILNYRSPLPASALSAFSRSAMLGDAQHRRNVWWGDQGESGRATVAAALVQPCQDRLGRHRRSSPHRKPPAHRPGLLVVGVGHNGLGTQEGRAHPRKDGSRPQPRSSPPRTVCTAHSGFRSAPELLTSPQAGSNVHLDTSRSLAGPTPVLPFYFTSPS